jgi:hypothetical protein
MALDFIGDNWVADDSFFSFFGFGPDFVLGSETATDANCSAEITSSSSSLSSA